MDMNGKSVMGMIIVVILTVTVLIGVTDQQVGQVTNLQQITNESFTPILNKNVQLTAAGDNPVVQGSLTLTNTTTVLTEGFEYHVDYVNGAINVSNGTNIQALNATYQFEPDGFQSGTSATMLKLLVLFIAVGLLLFIGVKSGVV